MLVSENLPVYLCLVEIVIVAYVLLMVVTRPPSPELRRMTVPASLFVLILNLVTLTWWLA